MTVFSKIHDIIWHALGWEPHHPLPPSAPLIGISCAIPHTESVLAAIASVRASGAIPVLLTNHKERLAGLPLPKGLERSARVDAAVARDLNGLSGVLVMGNNGDIDPNLYGHAVNPHTRIEDNPARAAYEWSLIRQSIERKIPLVGICGGHQRINVLLEGSLHQHVPDLVGSDIHMQAGATEFYTPVIQIHTAPDTNFARMCDGVNKLYAPAPQAVPAGAFMDNSMHHQSVAKVGKGLRVAARTHENIRYPEGEIRSEGIIEAIEADPEGPYKDQFILGVQWHPEFGASPVSTRIFGELTNKAREYAQAHGLEHLPGETLGAAQTALSAHGNLKPEHIELPATQYWQKLIEAQQRIRSVAMNTI